VQGGDPTDQMKEKKLARAGHKGNGHEIKTGMKSF